jgi:glycosyltransferase involved in cell wall biosynthesis
MIFKMLPSSHISIVIPCRDESENLKTLIPQISEKFEQIGPFSYEILILNHDSRDFTSSLIIDFSKSGIPISEYKYSISDFKLGNMLLDGIQRAKGDFIITMDGDHSHQPNSLIDIIKAWENGHDFILGVRYNRNQHPFNPKQRYILSKIFNHFARFILRIPITDFTTGYRGFSKEIFSKIQKTMKSKGFEVHLELNGKLAKSAHHFTCVPIEYKKREKGKSKLKYASELCGYLKAVLWCYLYKIEKIDEKLTGFDKTNFN